MEKKYNPFEKRYPNRKEIAYFKDRESEKKIEAYNKLNLNKNINSLNEKNKQLFLYTHEEKINDTDFYTKFSQYGQIPQIIQNNISTLNFETLTPIQKLSFAYLFNYKNLFVNCSKDLVGCAQTGSGKTIAYLIPTVSSLFNDPDGISQINQKSGNFGYKSYPLILIILPTRELAMQTYEESLKLLYKTSINTVVVYGGEGYTSQARELNDGCDIIIGTPGRLIDYLGKNYIDLSEIKYVIIDEADKLLDMGFEEDINHILYDFKYPDNCSTLLFSATFPKKVIGMVESIMKEDYAYITPGEYLGDIDETNGNVKQRFYFIECNKYDIFQRKKETLYDLLNVLQGKTLVFVNKKIDVEALCKDLDGNDFDVVGIHGDKDIKERKYALSKFKNGKVNLMIASDVASRGLDIPEVDYVINFDMPNNIDVYVHRIGRTGRVGNKGSSLTFLTDDDRIIFRGIISLLNKTGQEIPKWMF